MYWRNQGIGFVQKSEPEILQQIVSYLRASTWKQGRSGLGGGREPLDARRAASEREVRGDCNTARPSPYPLPEIMEER
jgi:hypothetical protein